MKPTQINHPLRTITLQYNSEATLSDFEKNFISQYRSLHDDVLNMQQQLLQLSSAIEKKQEEIKLPVNGYDKLKNETKIYEGLLGIDDKDIPGDDEHRINPQVFQERLDEYSVALDAYWIDVEPMHLLYNEVFEKVNAFDDVFEKFDRQYSRPFFKNYESMEIDICSFDDDENEFKDRWMDVYKLYENTVDGYNDWLQLHNTLATNIKTLYVRIKKIFNHIRELQRFDKGKKGDSFSSN